LSFCSSENQISNFFSEYTKNTVKGTSNS